MKMVYALCLSLLAATCQAADLSTPYSVAYKKAMAEERPLVVLVGATWCPNCTLLKRTLSKMPNVGDCILTTVDFDAQRQQAKKLLTSDIVPELVIFVKTEKGWERESLIGNQSEQALKEFMGLE